MEQKLEKRGRKITIYGSSAKRRKPLKKRDLRPAIVLGATRFELDSKDPQKQGLFSIADIASTQFGTRLNYFEQILSFFDSLEPSEQESLLDALKERVKATK